MRTVQRLPGEYWWGGAIDIGSRAPMGRVLVECDLASPPRDASGQPQPSGQSAPVLVSTAGRVIASTEPFWYRVDAQHIVCDAELYHPGQSLREAYLWASQRFFPPSQKTPAKELLERVQYNTWIEMPYHPTQAAVTQYAESLLAAGMPPGIIMIDDLWARDYGDWRFDRTAFPEPAHMVDWLHSHGFAVMLWVVPFVSPDSEVFRELERMQALLLDASGQPAIRRWWNGYSAVLDVTREPAVAWLRQRLDALGVDGFKFDGGDVGFYHADDADSAAPVEHCQAWAELGEHYAFNEFRACWKMGGRPLGQRLQDKPATWADTGIGSLIPEVLGQGMIGHAFTCPDMIGGGEISSVSAQTAVDQAFVVRYAQAAALMPMMQFSANPSRILDSAHMDLIHRALATREQHLPLILRLADEAAVTGEPIVRPMAYHCCDAEAASINDQFFLGPDLIVAPQVTTAPSRRVYLPGGEWLDDQGRRWRGGWIEVATPLERLPHFTRC